jgi:hypothetical protein
LSRCGRRQRRPPRRLLRKEMMYETFFSSRDADVGALVAYLSCLAESAQGRPVFQDCRLFT